ncbi:MAG: hypothetical protein LAO31_21410 [Acidobacteriia bacterium]|nr:hypothetical protein [Terriglobia bacterium]
MFIPYLTFSLILFSLTFLSGTPAIQAPPTQTSLSGTQSSDDRSLRKKLPTNAREQLLFNLADEIESGLHGCEDEFRAYGTARLGKIVYRFDKERARRLWVESFNSSLGLKPKSALLEASEEGGAPQLNAYRRATEESPGKTQAMIFRSLVGVGDLDLADEMLMRLPKQKLLHASKTTKFLPISIGTQEELADALLMMPRARWKQSPREAQKEFMEIVNKFDDLPYMQAAGYLKLQTNSPEYSQGTAQVLIDHFSLRDLSEENPVVSMKTLRQFENLLPSLGPVYAARGARLLTRKLDALEADSARWKTWRQQFDARLCMYLETDPAEACRAHETTPPRDLPAPVKEIIDEGKTRRDILVAAEKDPQRGVQLANLLPKGVDRGEALADLAELLGQQNPEDSKRLLKEALDMIEHDRTAQKSRILRALTIVGKIAANLDPDLFQAAIDAGISLIGDDTFERTDDVTRWAYVDSAVNFLGLWMTKNPDKALARVRTLPDSELRVRVLLSAAQSL